MNKQNVILITGMSGSGKSIAAKALEDMGYFCIDNLPLPLLPQLLDLLRPKHSKLAVVIDIRQPDFHHSGLELLKKLRSKEGIKLLFFDCDDQTLIRRYAESRRPHPLSGNHLSATIQRERELLIPFRELADLIIDTSNLTPTQLRQYLNELFCNNEEPNTLTVTLMSFGFKHGLPLDHDYLFDVRFLPNPFWEEDLRPLTGRSEEIAQYLQKFDETRKFLGQLYPFLSSVLEYFSKSDRLFLRIAFGCTGGKHRSVYIAETIFKKLKDKYRVKILHRDIEKPSTAPQKR